MTGSTTDADPELTTTSFAEAVAEAEELIRNPPFPISEQELAEGLDYLAGSIRSSLQMAFDYDLEHPVLINPTHQYSRQGLDNPDDVSNVHKCEAPGLRSDWGRGAAKCPASIPHDRRRRCSG